MCLLLVERFGWIFCLPSSLSLRFCPDWGWNVSIACGMLRNSPKYDTGTLQPYMAYIRSVRRQLT